MEIILGKTAGFCGGVKNAVEKTEAILNESREKPVFCLGNIVHNKQVVDSLTRKGLKVIDNIEKANKKVIIRAHGIPKEIYERAQEKNIELIDLTCKKVIQIHKLADEYAKRGYYIMLLGNKNHPEVIGIYSFCGNNSSIIENVDDIEEAVKKLEESGKKDVVIMAQTTFNGDKFKQIVEIIKNKVNKNTNLEIKNTICAATNSRQEETKKIAKQVDFMIIIGDKQSSNTNKLYEIAKEECRNVIFVHDKSEVNLNNIKQFNKIGVMAGASTPKNIIDEVIYKLKNDCKI